MSVIIITPLPQDPEEFMGRALASPSPTCPHQGCQQGKTASCKALVFPSLEGSAVLKGAVSALPWCCSPSPCCQPTPPHNPSVPVPTPHPHSAPPNHTPTPHPPASCPLPPACAWTCQDSRPQAGCVSLKDGETSLFSGENWS